MTTVLQEARKRAGISLREFQKRSGIHFSRISRQERRREPLFPRDVQRYANALGVDGKQLIDENGYARIFED